MDGEIDLTYLYREPFLAELQRIENDCSSIYDFSLRVKQCVVQQKYKMHLRVYQYLYEMRTMCLDLKQYFYYITPYIALYQKAAANTSDLNENLQVVSRLKGEINNLKLKPVKVAYLTCYVMHTEDFKFNDSFADMQLYKIQQQFLSSTPDAMAQQVLRHLMYYCLTSNSTNPEGANRLSFRYYMGKFNKRVLDMYSQSLNNFLQLQNNQLLANLLNVISPIKYKQLIIYHLNKIIQMVTEQCSASQNVYDLTYNFYNNYKFYKDYLIELLGHSGESLLLFNQVYQQVFNPYFGIMLGKVCFNSGKEYVFVNQAVEFIENSSKIQSILEFFVQLSAQYPKEYKYEIRYLLDVFFANQDNAVPKFIMDEILARREEIVTEVTASCSAVSEHDAVVRMVCSVQQALISKLFDYSQCEYFYNIQIVSYIYDSYDSIASIKSKYYEKLCQYVDSVDFTENLLAGKEKMIYLFDVYQIIHGTFGCEQLTQYIRTMQNKYLVQLSKLIVQHGYTVAELRQEYDWIQKYGIDGGISWEEAAEVFYEAQKAQIKDAAPEAYVFQL